MEAADGSDACRCRWFWLLSEPEDGDTDDKAGGVWRGAVDSVFRASILAAGFEELLADHDQNPGRVFAVV